jgi:S1-C subfamily serine protease
MRTPLLLSLCALLALPLGARSAAPPPRPGPVADSVVKITATLRYPNPIRPWTQSKSQEVSGTGVVISGNKILTNAHVVLYATEVHVQTGPGADKFEATVESMGPTIDLAVLRVNDRTFFDKRFPLRRASKLPEVRDAVEVYGFPIGGDEMSVTKGTISRVEYGSRFYEDTLGLILQVSAAVNPGNSGGPAVVNGKMVGVVSSQLGGAQNIGYVIPNEEIDFYLEDVKDGRYDGKPRDASWTQYQTLENPTLRTFLKLDRQARGILAVPMRPRLKENPFQDFDLVTRIGEHDIDNLGMVRRENGLRVPFQGMIPRLARGNAVPLTIIRGGKRMNVSLPVTTADTRLIPKLRGEQLPYFIHGPLVFCPARDEVVSTYLRFHPSRLSPLLLRGADRVRFPGEELVVVTAPMFQHKISKGYSDPVGQVLQEINGTKVKNLRHLVELLRDSKDEYLKFRFEEGAEVLVFRRTEMAKATEEILDDAGIALGRRGSRDMLAVWRGGKSDPSKKE